MGNRARLTPSVVAALVLVAAALVAGCGGSSSGDSSKSGGAKETKISVALGASTLLYSPVYIADIKGYFKDQGLQVKQSQVVAAASMHRNPATTRALMEQVLAWFPRLR